jgi:RNA polymerase sigma factor (sigma-70 family)
MDPWELALDHRHVVAGMAAKLARQQADRDDLIQEGLIGLHRAALRYRGVRGAAFMTYAWRDLLKSMHGALRRGSPGDVPIREDLTAAGPGTGPMGDDERRRIDDAIGRLSDRMRTIVRQHHGLDGAAPRLLREIGADLGLSVSRTCHIHREALAKLALTPGLLA